MKRFGSILGFLAPFLVASAALGAGRGPVPIGYPELWRRANQVFAIHGLTVTRSDSELGVIEGSRKDGAIDGWFNCPASRGAVEGKGYSVTILLDAAGPESTGIRISAYGITTSYQNRYFLVFKKSPLHSEVRCDSTGKLEQLLYSEMVGSESR